jgi:signal transduction histidine kinase
VKTAPILVRTMKSRTAMPKPGLASPAGSSGRPYRRLYRDPDNRVLAGVAAGLSEHLGLPVIAVRLAFVALLAANGLGALLYVAFWAVLPASPSVRGRKRSRRLTVLQALGLGAFGVGVIVLRANLSGFGVDSTVIALFAVIALGAGIIWHQADPQRRRRTEGDEVVEAAGPAPVMIPVTPRIAEAAAETPGGRWFALRMIGGGLLVVVGIIGILAIFAPESSNGLGVTLTGLVFGLLALAGLVLALAPLFYRVFGQLRVERIARIREQERAEVAAVVHDQVLHTLALIQRNAGDTTSVLRLARGQERTLRNWLYKPAGSPNDRLAAALEQVAAEVEDTYGIGVETVVVGDAEHDERVAALVAATREALVNAARHAKVSTVSLYAEAEEDRFSVFVRDRGAGFDLSTVDSDRQGVRGSIIGRMQRHGGHANVRSSPGEGTEVELTMPRSRKE